MFKLLLQQELKPQLLQQLKPLLHQEVQLAMHNESQTPPQSGTQNVVQHEVHNDQHNVIHNVPLKDFSKESISLKNDCNALLNSALCLKSSRVYAHARTHSSPPSS